MPAFTVWMLENAHITISDGASLSGKTQGDGSHLVQRTIILNRNAWLETRVEDNDTTFDDNDGSQRLFKTQAIDGAKVDAGTRVEAEYRLTLRDPQTGRSYDVYGYNVNNSNTSYGTVEGLAFLGGPGGFPPVGIRLEVTGAEEGPGSGNKRAVAYDQLATPPCFTPDTLIRTPRGPRRVEAIRPGDLVSTLDAGDQPLVWAGSVTVGPRRLAATPALRPIRIRQGALGAGLPARDLLVSPQHRVLIGGWRAELLFGSVQVLVAARHLVDGRRVQVASDIRSVTYLHLMFNAHQVIWAEDAPTESFHPAARHLLLPDQTAELLRLFPALQATAGHIPAARPCLRQWEARALAL